MSDQFKTTREDRIRVFRLRNHFAECFPGVTWDREAFVAWVDQCASEMDRNAKRIFESLRNDRIDRAEERR